MATASPSARPPARLRGDSGATSSAAARAVTATRTETSAMTGDAESQRDVAEELLILPPASSREENAPLASYEPEVEDQRLEVYVQALHFEPVVLHATVSIQALCDEPHLQEFHPTDKLHGAVRQLTALQNVTLTLEGVKCTEVYEEIDSLVEKIVRGYTMEVLMQVGKVIGSLDFIGNPLAMLSDISGGVKTFIREPQRGALKSPTAFARGVGVGTAGLVGGVVGGVSAGVASVFTAGSNMGVLVTTEMAMDNAYANRRRLAQQERATSFGDGVLMGAEALRDGVWSGATGLIQQPVAGARSGGAAGAMVGLGKGVVGLLAKPLSGVAGMASKVTEGLGSEAKKLTTTSMEAAWRFSALRIRQPRLLWDGVLRNYPREPPLKLSSADRLALMQGRGISHLLLDSGAAGSSTDNNAGTSDHRQSTAQDAAGAAGDAPAGALPDSAPMDMRPDTSTADARRL